MTILLEFNARNIITGFDLPHQLLSI